MNSPSHFVAFFVGVLLTIGAYSLSGSSKERAVEQSCPDGGLDSLLLERQRESFEKALQNARDNCDLASTIERSTRDRQLLEERRRREELETKRAAAAKARKLLQKARSGQLLITEWNTLAIGKTKSEIITLLGSPDGMVKPRTSDEYSLEMWSYKKKVRLEESPAKRAVVLYFHKHRVEKAVSVDK